MKIDTPNIIGEVIDSTNIKDELDARVDMVADNIDWSLGVSFIHPPITGPITLTDSNVPQGTKSKTISLEISGDFVITFPAYYIPKGTVDYDGLVSNKITIDCINGNAGFEQFHYIITPTI